MELGQAQPWGADSFPSESDRTTYMQLTDEAKRKQAHIQQTAKNLQIAFDPKANGAMQTTDDAILDRFMSKFRDPSVALTDRIHKLRLSATEAEKSGNGPAGATYRQAALILMGRLKKFQKIKQQTAEELKDEEATSQPAGAE